MPISTTRSSARILTAVGAFVLALAAGVAPLAPAYSASAADDDGAVGVATRPAGADGRPDQRSRFSYAADPGQTVTDQVLVGNTGTERQDFTVYATDAYNTQDGTFALLATDAEPTAIGRWIRFENGEDRISFALDPDEVRLLTFTVAFPPEATPGDHVGGLVASVLEEGQTVSLDRRVATAIYARVSGELQPLLKVSRFAAERQGEWWDPFGGTVLVRYTVENAGNVALGANVTTGVATWFGIPSTGDQGGSNPVLLPGNSADYEVELTGVGQWLYLNPHVRLNPFVDSSDPDAQLMPVPAVSRDTVVWGVPWIPLLVLLVVAIVVTIVVLWRRRENQRALDWVEHAQEEARQQARQELAEVEHESAPTRG